MTELYRVQTGLKQCYNCQNIGHIYANCKQLPRCLWYGGVYLRTECPEKTNAVSTPSCCNYTQAEREEPHLTSYRGCRHPKWELTWRRAKRAPKRSSGRTFFSKDTLLEKSYAAALFQDREQKNYRHRRFMRKALSPSRRAAAVTTAEYPENRSVSTGFKFA
jgi:hypothetical protein